LKKSQRVYTNPLINRVLLIDVILSKAKNPLLMHERGMFRFAQHDVHFLDGIRFILLQTMSPRDESNVTFSLAADFINHTSKSVFLTGKAGTGKTTFLKYICENTSKNFVVAAPTGVAAINAGGVTLHSLFQLPFGIYLPLHHNPESYTSVQVSTRSTLFKNLQLNKNKRDLLQELELLIIDEVSMVRADMLDAIDVILKSVRKNQRPFGGVQVLFIGDLYQLCPVAKGEEWKILQEYYQSPYFFDSKVVLENPPLCIELKKIYRQNEEIFIDLLNNVRNNVATAQDLALLNSRLNPSENTEGFVTLTTHNEKANAINVRELEKLPGKGYEFSAIIQNEFSDKSYPTDSVLLLKKGARVMFIKNDTSEEKKYYNGKIATVTDIDGETVTVEFDQGGTLELTQETWRNIRYQYNDDTDEIDEEELGSFTQFPIRLAWAITIHKSQGLTFQNAIIDAGSSFATGQVYVALSRCTSLNGLVLKTPITHQQISTDPKVIAYAKQLKDEFALSDILQREREVFEKHHFVKLFDFNKVTRTLTDWQETLTAKKNEALNDTIQLSHELMRDAISLEEVSVKTQLWIERNFDEAHQNNSYDRLVEGLKKSVSHFNSLLHDNFFVKLQQHHAHVKSKAKMKKHVKSIEAVASLVAAKAAKLRHVTWREQRLFTGKEEQFANTLVKTPKEKVSSAAETFELYNQEGDIEKVARIRGLAISTIESHLVGFVKTGELAIERVVDPDKIKAIREISEKTGATGTSFLKNALGENYSYNEIRAVMYHLERMKSEA
jgi:PIF1-like helicase/Helix-turn-helix domain